MEYIAEILKDDIIQNITKSIGNENFINYAILSKEKRISHDQIIKYCFTNGYHVYILKRNIVEMIILVGSPASGKSSWAKKHFPKYSFVNQDILKTKDRCIKIAKQELDRGKSVIIDRTNPDIESRLLFIQIAKDHHIPCRCFYFTTPRHISLALNIFREKTEKIKKIPIIR